MVVDEGEHDEGEHKFGITTKASFKSLNILHTFTFLIKLGYYSSKFIETKINMSKLYY